jgi:SAM-dependent methyltransferase
MKMQLVLLARSAYHCLEDIGFHPLKLLSLRGLPGYLYDLVKFQRLRRLTPDITEATFLLTPMLSDRYGDAGAARSLYFLQDLLCSSRVLQQQPSSHLDIGSRIDGFVAQIAASRAIDVLDIRPLESSPSPNLRFIQGDILDPPSSLERRYDLVTSLHALEHVGLGRYGDPLAPDGFERALANAASFVSPGGRLLFALPVAEMQNNLLQFNSQRLFSHSRLAKLIEVLLPGFAATWSFVVDDSRLPRQIHADPSTLLSTFRGYGLCGIELYRQ